VAVAARGVREAPQYVVAVVDPQVAEGGFDGATQGSNDGVGKHGQSAGRFAWAMVESSIDLSTFGDPEFLRFLRTG